MFLELLFAAELRDGDLEIVRSASREQPGLARLGLATVGQCETGQPVYSRSGAKVGFLSPDALPPYYETYEIEEIQ